MRATRCGWRHVWRCRSEPWNGFLCVRHYCPSGFCRCEVPSVLAAWFVNFSTYGVAKQPENLGRWAILRRYNYLWFVPLLVMVFFIEDGKSYPVPSPQAFLIGFGFVSTPLGICCTFRDVLERRFGPSAKRERGARIFAAIVASGVALFVYFSEAL